MADRHPDHDLLAELEPVAEQLLDRHLSMAKEWLPHEYIPWSLGRDFDTDLRERRQRAEEAQLGDVRGAAMTPTAPAAPPIRRCGRWAIGWSGDLARLPCC